MHSSISLSQDKPGDMTREEALSQIRQRIALGVPVKRACEQVGIIRSTYYRWEEEEKEKGQSSAEADPATSFEAGTSDAKSTTSPAAEGKGERT